jgi:branched-chain amino acid aminotransferase
MGADQVPALQRPSLPDPQQTRLTACEAEQIPSAAVTPGFEELASVDGTITPTAEATIGLKDDGLYRGDGAFEVIRLYGGKPFALVDHLDRLVRSAGAIQLEFDRSALEAEIDTLLAQAGPVEGQMRLIVTRGGRRIAATEPIPPHPHTVRLATVTYCPTVILNGVKSLSYAANMQATRIAKGQGADEAVLIRPEGTVLEPPTSAVFWVSAGGHLCTPALDDGVLESITRDRMIKALEVEEGTWHVDDLRGASEAFLASTTREIQAVSSIDGKAFQEAPGPRTREAQEAFAETLGRELREL